MDETPILTGKRRYPTTRAEHARRLHVARLKRRRARRQQHHPATPPRIVFRIDTRAFNASMAGFAQAVAKVASAFRAAAEAAAPGFQRVAEQIAAATRPPRSL